MFNPIEEKRRFVQAQIQKSFESGINVSEETDIEKATYVDNSENRKLGRVGQQYGGTKEPKNKPTTQLSMTIDAIDDFIEASEKFSKMKPTDNGYAEQKKKLLGFAKLADETGDRLTTAELKELKNNHPKHAETLKTIFKMSAAIKAECDELEKAHKDGDHHPTKPWVWVSSANGGKGDWRVEGGRSHKKAGASTTPAPRKPGSTDEIERMNPSGVRNAILGLNKMDTIVADKGDHFHIYFDENDFTTHGQRSPQIDRIAKFLEGMGASCVIGKCSIKAYKKVEKKTNAVKIDDTTIDQSEYDRMYEQVKSADESGRTMGLMIIETNLKNAKSRLMDAIKNRPGAKKTIATFQKELTMFVSQKKAADDAIADIKKKKSDPRNKIAQDAGFTDYEEMRGFQEYASSKSLLKKPSTKGDTRKQLEDKIADYEKNHADVIKKVQSKDKAKSVKKDTKKKVPSGGKINYEDDLVEVYDASGKKVYSGILDYCPYKDENYKWNNADKNYDLPKGYKMVGKS